MKYYNYIYLDPRKSGRYTYEGLNFSLLFEPFYVGKGSGNRSEFHVKYAVKYNKSLPKNQKIRKLLKYNIHPFIIIVNQINDENLSLEHERNIIQKIGIDNLTNIQPGGSKSDSFSNHPNKETYRYNISEGTKRGLQSMSNEARMNMINNRNSVISKPEIKQKQRENTKKGMQNMSEQSKEQMKQNMKGNNNNKKKWILSNTLGDTFVIEDLKKFCQDMCVSYSFIFYTLKNSKKNRFWSIQHLC